MLTILTGCWVGNCLSLTLEKSSWLIGEKKSCRKSKARRQDFENGGRLTCALARKWISGLLARAPRDDPVQGLYQPDDGVRRQDFKSSAIVEKLICRLY